MEPAYGENAGNSKSCVNSENIKIKLGNMEPNDDSTEDSKHAGISEENTNLCKVCSKISYLKDLNEQFVCQECCPLENVNSKAKDTYSNNEQHSGPAEELESYIEIKVEEATISNVAITYQTLHKSDFKANKKLNADKYVNRLGDSYICTKCPEGLRQPYTAATRARKHIKMKHFGYRFECTECAAKYLNSTLLRKHYKTQHAIEYRNKIELTNYELEGCEKLDLNKHIKKLDNSYVCGLCPESKRTLYRSTTGLRLHIKISHYGHRYACPDCNEKYSTPVALKRHFNIVHSTNDANSLRVELTGGYKLLPISHELAKEPRAPQLKNFNEEKIAPLIKKVNNFFICTLCPRDKSLHYKKIESVRLHMRFRHYGYGYVCAECGHKYICKISLQKHYKIQHNMDAPTTIELNRNFELSVQSNETKSQIKKIGNHYLCSVCPKTKTVKYANFYRIQRHIKVVHQGYRYECSVCGAKYTLLVTLKSHYRTEHNRKDSIKTTLTKYFRPGLSTLYKQHQAEQEFKQSFSSKTGYVRKKLKHNRFYYFCTLCSTEKRKSHKYKHLEIVESHIKISHHGYRYRCTECGTKYCDLSNFNKHYKNKHKIEAPANIVLTKLDGVGLRAGI